MTIADVLRHDDFILALCSFLDDFRRSGNRLALISEEPQYERMNRVNLCVLAAVAHKLSNDSGLDVPKWTKRDLYIMPYPVYSFDTENEEYQRFLHETSPSEFTCRNLCFGANAVERV